MSTNKAVGGSRTTPSMASTTVAASSGGGTVTPTRGTINNNQNNRSQYLDVVMGPSMAPQLMSSTPTTPKGRGAMMKPPTPPSSKMAPNHLPPKSPASINGRKLLPVGSNNSFSSSSSTNSSRSRTKGGSRRKRRGRSRSRGRRITSDSTDSGSDTSEDSDLPRASPLKDPSPEHLSVETDTDDLSNAEDFSLISFDTKSNTSTTSSIGLSTSSSRASVLSKDPLTGILHSSNSGAAHASRRSQHSHRRSHRRSSSWDSAGAQGGELNPDVAAAIGDKSCFAVPKILQRRQRVMVADVASVGNASDTLVPAENGRITGRELHETAKAFLNDGDYEQALTMFEAILQAQMDRFGEEHSSVGAALHNVGVVRLRMGEHLVAEEVFARAVAIRRSVLGPDDLDLSATLAKLGSARVALQKFDEGLQDLRQSLQITRKVLGRNHRAVAQILCHIACLYFEAGEMFSAQATFEDALDIYRGVFQGETDRDACMAQMTETLCNIGSIQNKRKNFTGAIESFREALDLQRGIMGHDHPRVIASLDNLGYSFSKHKSYNQALACYKEMLNAQISQYGCFTMDCCDTLKKQVLIYGKLKNTDEALEAVTSHLEMVRANEQLAIGDSVVLEVEQMLSDLKSRAKKISKQKSKKSEKGLRDRSLDCFERILFDKRRGEF